MTTLLLLVCCVFLGLVSPVSGKPTYGASAAIPAATLYEVRFLCLALDDVQAAMDEDADAGPAIAAANVQLRRLPGRQHWSVAVVPATNNPEELRIKVAGPIYVDTGELQLGYYVFPGGDPNEDEGEVFEGCTASWHFARIISARQGYALWRGVPTEEDILCLYNGIPAFGLWPDQGVVRFEDSQLTEEFLRCKLRGTKYENWSPAP